MRTGKSYKTHTGGGAKKLAIGTAAFLDTQIKGHEYVIRALHELKVKGITNIEYRLLGSGSPGKLVRLAESLDVAGQLKVCGVLPHDEIFTWYDDLDVYIQPSRTETLGRSVVEAMSRGLPAACSRVGGMAEYASKNIMFTAGNVKEISAVIESLIDPAVREREARNSFRIAHDFSKEKLDAIRNEFYAEFTGVTSMRGR